jgi:KipI family sensor histidine kinase inhibitor
LEVERLTGLRREEIVEIHSGAIYDVWLLGFMPGFPYLGSLDLRLRIPRKIRPDLAVPAGSVAIAEEFTGVYPADSPGGWHVIGRTPNKLVDFTKSPPWLFDYGMRIQIQPISRNEFLQFERIGK